jgi:hypothetical protein
MLGKTNVTVFRVIKDSLLYEVAAMVFGSLANVNRCLPY